MNPQTFLKEFGAVANAPGGVQRLREMILQLAVMGKLVEHDPEDEPAGELLKRIESEKEELISKKIIKKAKVVSKSKSIHNLNSLPAEWIWTEIENVFYSISVPNKKKLPSKQINSKGLYHVIDQGKSFIAGYSDDANKLIEIPATVIVFGDHTKELKLIDFDFIPGADGIKVLRPIEINEYYFFIVLKSLSIEDRGYGRHFKKLLDNFFPLPPLKEQKRIVTKVDQLMALCDQLEAQQQKRSKLIKNTRISALEALADASGGDELKAAWDRVENNLAMLFEAPEDVEDLKKCILQNAVMGKLVPQNPDDEPASELLSKIAEEKADLIRKKEIKKQKPLPGIREDEKPFGIPVGWEFAHLQTICKWITDGTHQTPKYTNTGRPFISAQCVKPFRFMPNKCRYVSEEHYQQYIKNRKPEYRDILLSRVGAGIGEAALVDKHIEFAIYVSTGLIKPFKQYLFSEYLLIWLNSPVGRKYSKKNTLGKGVSQGNLNLSLIRTFIVSIPPFEEQKRIVSKVQSLLLLCNTLQTQLATSKKIAEQLAKSVVENITGISTEKPVNGLKT